MTQARIGLPSGQAGQQAGRSRNGAWAPVAVTLKGGQAGNARDLYRLRIETKDLEEVRYQYTVPVPALSVGQQATVQGYIVPAGDGATFRVDLETIDPKTGAAGQVVQSLTKLSRDATREEVIGQEDILYFTIGGPLAGLRRAAEKLDKPDGKEPEHVIARRQFTAADRVELLPDRWFGYDAVDVVVLTTSNLDLIRELDQDAARRAALLTWVRRGGQLLISVGRNQQEVSRLLAKWPLLNVKIEGAEQVARLPIFSQFATTEARDVLSGATVATVVPGAGTHVVLREDNRPVIVQASCGLGRVMLVALDLDAAPVTAWSGQQDLWKELQKELSPPLNERKGGPQAPPGRRPPPGVGGMPGLGGDSRFDMKTELKRRLELFEEVPTISFGWVALFILFYILLVGPIDYFVLKKVFKRLEWTWVTFPATVLLVSVLAYVIAYRVKGDDVRINKVDLVEVDLHAPRQAYGHSYFTLFSPRVQSYTLGLEPDRDAWVDQAPDGAIGPVLTLLEGGDRPTRAGAQPLFSRPYEYAPDAAGLLRVPVSVWSTRSFTAAWQAPLKAKPPISIDGPEGALRYRAAENALVGQLTNNLTTELLDLTLFFRHRVYSIKRLAPGESFRIDQQLFGANAAGQRREVSGWFDDDTLAGGIPLAPSGRPVNAAFAQGRSIHHLLKPLLFFREAGRPDTASAGLRSLDQTWRIRRQAQYPAGETYRDEVVLVARAPTLVDRAEVVATHGASPTRLWLGKLPGSGEERPELPGFLTQETFLRVYIPVRTER